MTIHLYLLFKDLFHVHSPLTCKKNHFSSINLRSSPPRHQSGSRTAIDLLCSGSIGAFPLWTYANTTIAFSCGSQQLLSQVSRRLNSLRTLELFVSQREDDRRCNGKPHLLPGRIAAQCRQRGQIALWTDCYMTRDFPAPESPIESSPFCSQQLGPGDSPTQ